MSSSEDVIIIDDYTDSDGDLDLTDTQLSTSNTVIPSQCQSAGQSSIDVVKSEPWSTADSSEKKGDSSKISGITDVQESLQDNCDDDVDRVIDIGDYHVDALSGDDLQLTLEEYAFIQNSLHDIHQSDGLDTADSASNSCAEEISSHGKRLVRGKTRFKHTPLRQLNTPVYEQNEELAAAITTDDIAPGIEDRPSQLVTPVDIIEKPPVECQGCEQTHSHNKLVECCDGHFVCEACVTKTTKQVLNGEKKGSVCCPKPHCTSSVPMSELRKVHPSLVIELLEDKWNKETMEALEQMADVVKCPGCKLSVVLDIDVPNFKCTNCNMSYCRYCDKKMNEKCHDLCIKTKTWTSQQTGNVVNIPALWDDPHDNQDYSLVELSLSSSEFVLISEHMRRTGSELNIHKIFRVQNHKIWEKFSVTRSHMIGELGEVGLRETRLFHGTQISFIDDICKEGFDWRLCGKNGTVWGHGVYFAKRSMDSHQYSSKNHPSGTSRNIRLARAMAGLHRRHVRGNFSGGVYFPGSSSVPLPGNSSLPPPFNFGTSRHASGFTFGSVTSAGGTQPTSSHGSGFTFGPITSTGGTQPTSSHTSGFTFGPATSTGGTQATSSHTSGFTFGPVASTGGTQATSSHTSGFTFGPVTSTRGTQATSSHTSGFTLGPVTSTGGTQATSSPTRVFTFGPVTSTGGTQPTSSHTSGFAFGSPASSHASGFTNRVWPPEPRFQPVQQRHGVCSEASQTCSGRCIYSTRNYRIPSASSASSSTTTTSSTPHSTSTRHEQTSDVSDRLATTSDTSPSTGVTGLSASQKRHKIIADLLLQKKLREAREKLKHLRKKTKTATSSSSNSELSTASLPASANTTDVSATNTSPQRHFIERSKVQAAIKLQTELIKKANQNLQRQSEMRKDSGLTSGKVAEDPGAQSTGTTVSSNSTASMTSASKDRDPVWIDQIRQGLIKHLANMQKPPNCPPTQEVFGNSTASRNTNTTPGVFGNSTASTTTIRSPVVSVNSTTSGITSTNEADNVWGSLPLFSRYTGAIPMPPPPSVVNTPLFSRYTGALPMPPPPSVVNTNNTNYNCSNVKPSGSNVSRTPCTPPLFPMDIPPPDLTFGRKKTGKRRVPVHLLHTDPHNLSHSKYSGASCPKKKKAEGTKKELPRVKLEAGIKEELMEVDDQTVPDANQTSTFNKDQALLSGDYFMFVSRVLIGRTCRGESTMRRPSKDDQGRMTHTAVNSQSSPSIYVVFDNTHCYPEYLIQYKLS